MSYLHSNNILHRDLKPANILIDEFFLPKIADFGLSTINSKSEKQIKGTPIYIAPEIWWNSNYSKASDVYAFGIILYQILTDEKPFKNFQCFEIMLKVGKGYRPEFKQEIPQCYRSLIERCWSQEPENRPTFDEILEILKSDKIFITESIKKEEFLNYIDYLNNYQITFNLKNNNIEINTKITETISTETDEKLDINKIHSISKFGFFKPKDFMKLEEKCQSLILDANDDPQKHFKIAKSLIEGLDYFQFNTEIGLKYLKDSIKKGNIEALIYYCRMLIKGKVIPQNLEKAKKIIQTKLSDEKGLCSLLMGKIMKKEGKFIEAKKLFLDSIDLENDEAMFEYGKMLYKGIGSEPDDGGLIFYKEASSKANFKACYKFALILKDKNILIKENKKAYIEFIEVSANYGYPDALLYYSQMIEEGVDVPYNVDNAFYCKRMSAFLGSIEGMYQYALHCYRLKYKKVNYEESKKFFKKASDRGHVDAMFKYGLILSEENNKEGEKLIKYSAFNGNPNAMFNYGLKLVQGIGIQMNIDEGLNYLKKAADCGNIFAMVLYGITLKKHFNDNKTNEEAIKYFKMAADKDDPYGLMFYGESMIDNNGDLNKENINEESVNYIKKSILKGNIDAISVYALILLDGIGIKADKEEAIRYFQIGINLGSLKTMYSYASLLLQGDKIPMNKELGIKLLKMAADKGYEKAMNDYGMILINGLNIEMNKEKGAKYLKMAADKNYLPAICNYSYILANGIGVPVNKEIAVRYIKIAINKESSEAMRMYGSMLIKGIGVPINIKEGIKYLKMAIDKGDSGAMNCYADMLYNGIGIPINKEKAIKYYKMAIDKNCLEAMVHYGRLLTYENDPLKKEEGLKLIKKASDLGFNDAIRLYAELMNDEKSVDLLKDASDKGDPESLFKYGMMYYNGNGVEVNKEKAFNIIKKAVENGSINALNSYGIMLIKGEGVESNKEEGLKYLKMGADKGDIDAAFHYSYFLLNDNNDSNDKIDEQRNEEGLKYAKISAEKGNLSAMFFYAYKMISFDVNESLNYLQKAANKGHIESINYLINLYKEGKFVPQNNKEIVKYVKMAADFGSVDHMYLYSIKCLNGDDEIPPNEEEAFKYMKMAADLGSAEAMNKCGRLFEKGVGTSVNISEACHYYEMAIENGSVEANYFYGSMFMSGENVPVDLEKGVKYMKFAAENGDEYAMYQYGRILENGVTVPVDYVNAMKYYKLASDKGVQQAKFAMLLLFQKINSLKNSDT